MQCFNALRQTRFFVGIGGKQAHLNAGVTLLMVDHQ
jgi:hypothetical protein